MTLGMTVQELLNRISSRELAEWQAYSRINPFGSWRDDVRAATIACTIANVNSSDKQFEIKDFIPKFGKRKPMTEEQIKRALGF